MSKPICPDCNEVMVKALEQNEEGDWAYRWLCGCKVKTKLSLCPTCEMERDCRIVSSTFDVEELGCLWCGEEFEIDKFEHTPEEMAYYHKLTG